MSTTYGVYPEGHELVADDAGRTLTVRNRFYSITHSLDHGGAITGIQYHSGTDRNLLLGPCACEVALAGGVTYSQANDAQVTVQTDRAGSELTLTFQGFLRDAKGKDCGIAYRQTFLHRWGHVKIEQRLSFASPVRVSRVCAHSWTVRPELTHFGVRPGALDEPSTWTAAFGVCQWGHFSPGDAFNSPVQSRHVPRYVCCADPGREGLEWFVGSDLSQWDYQLAGGPGHGSLNLSAGTAPPAVHFSACPLDIPRGGVTLSGDYTFNYYIGVPIISGRANHLFLHRSFQRKNWPTEDLIKSYADRGVGSLHFHHDGDTHRDGQFWRDGSYPPFGPEDMKEYDRVIADCHRHGIRVATYFSNKELHPSVEAYQQHGAEWARLPDDTGEQVHNAYSGDEYGAQMCLRSGWLDFHKEYIDKVLSHHDLDGTYYDWNVALYCHNTHDGKTQPNPDGTGDWAHSPAGHWDMDELIDLMMWTRQRVGPDGLAIIHNTMVPMATTENYADSIVAMEWGYSKLATGAPPLDDLPLEWSFMGHRARGVIGYGCLEKDAPERVHRQMTLRALLTGVTPWPALDLDLDMFAPLWHRDLAPYQFAGPGSGLIATGSPSTPAALYSCPEEAIVLVGNLSDQDAQAQLQLDPPRVGLQAAGEYTVSISGTETTVSPEQLREGLPVGVSADAATAITIRPR